MSRVVTSGTIIDSKTRTPEWFWNWTPPVLSEEEELMLERLAVRVKENIAQEKMTPRDRLIAVDSGQVPDRVPLFSGEGESLANVRVLDSWAEVLKPLDMYRYPKLNLIAQLAWVAKFGHDAITPYTLTYGEAEWGGKVKYLERSSPILAEPVLKNPEEIEELVIPDPEKDGRYPAYLWLVRMIKEWLTKYDIPMLIEASICTGPASTAGLIRGWKDLLIDMKKNPDFVHKLVQLTCKFSTRFGKAVLKAGADALYTCDEAMCFYPPSLFRELMPYYEKVNEELPVNVWIVEGSNKHLEIIASAKGTSAVAQDTRENLEETTRICHERNIFLEVVIDAEIVRTGTVGDLEAEFKRLIKTLSKYNTKFAIAQLPDYYTPIERVQRFMEVGKRVGQYPLTY